MPVLPCEPVSASTVSVGQPVERRGGPAGRARPPGRRPRRSARRSAGVPSTAAAPAATAGRRSRGRRRARRRTRRTARRARRSRLSTKAGPVDGQRRVAVHRRRRRRAAISASVSGIIGAASPAPRAATVAVVERVHRRRAISWPVSWPLPATSTMSPAAARRDGLRGSPPAGRRPRCTSRGAASRVPGEHRGADRGRVLGARVVVGDDQHVGEPRRRSRPSSAACRGPGRRRRRARRSAGPSVSGRSVRERGLDRVRLVGVVDDRPGSPGRRRPAPAGRARRRRAPSPAATAVGVEAGLAAARRSAHRALATLKSPGSGTAGGTRVARPGRRTVNVEPPALERRRRSARQSAVGAATREGAHRDRSPRRPAGGRTRRRR